VTDLLPAAMIEAMADAPPVLAVAAAVPLLVGVAVRSRAAMSAGLLLVMLAAACLGLVTLVAGGAPPLAADEVARGVAQGRVPAGDLLPMLIYGSGAAAAVVLGLVSVMPRYDRGLAAVVLCAALACGVVHVSAAEAANAPDAVATATSP